MFTGIIEELGVVTSLVRSASSGKLVISVNQEISQSKIGDSIGVNGVCLTITGIRRNLLEFDISFETIKRTALQDLKIGARVNLERALRLADRLGGHIVNGHVDGVAEIRKIIKAGKGFDLYLSLPSELIRYIVPKASVAIDGVSLTVADMRDGLVMIAVIPHTVATTTLGERRIGDRVNIEVDVLSKYIEQHLKGEVKKGISEETMTRVGFMPMGWIEN
ncbi:MAG: riboflavin synthase [bacterium]